MDYDINDFSLDFFSLKGKTVIVTGGNTGLGQTFSLAMAKAGADLFIPSLREDGGETKRLIESAGQRMEFMQADISQKGTAKNVVDSCLDAYGKIDVLVNCAGLLIKVKNFTEFGREQYDKMMSVNIDAAFEMSYETARVMIGQKSGKMINICSMFSFVSNLTSPAYTISKHAIAGLTKTYCNELAPFGIQVNGIAPGFYATELTSITRSNPEAYKAIESRIPAKRWGETQELMGTAVFLASNAADYINGAIIPVDGGYLVR